MSRFSLAISVALTLVISGCTNKPDATPVVVKDNVANFNVEKLFTIDNCTVYRFQDNYTHYFTNCSGQTMTQQSYQCGKSRCHRPENISGGK